MRWLIAVCVLLCTARIASAAIPSTAVWEFQATVINGSMLQGGGFDPGATLAITDAAATSATGNSPEISSATYTFVAGDVGSWVYVKSGTNWIPGWYPITSINGNNAVVNATVGAAIWVPKNADCTAAAAPWPCCTGSTTGTCLDLFQANTVAGVASTASPTSGTIGVDYSQQAAPQDSGTDLASADGDAIPCVITSDTHNFVANDVGNAVHITAGTGWTAGWYFIASVSGNAATLDRACGTDGAKSSGTWYLGGALALGSSTLDDAFFEQIVAGNDIWIKSGDYTQGAASIAVASTACTHTDPCYIRGYGTLRGDTPTGSTRPHIATGAYSILLGVYQNFFNIRVSGTGSPVLRPHTGVMLRNCAVANLSASANLYGIESYANTAIIVDTEAVSLNGYALYIDSAARMNGLYLHDSNYGVSFYGISTGVGFLRDSIVAHNRSGGVLCTFTSGHGLFQGNTFYQYGNAGTGIAYSTYCTNMMLQNNIITGYATGASSTAASGSNVSDYNDWYNNTADVSNVSKGAHELAVDPQFAGVTELAVAGATSANNKIVTDSDNDFSSVTNYEDFFHLTGGTNGVVGIYQIVAHDTTTLTLNNDCDTGGNGSALAGYVTTGHNFAVGANLKGAAYPGPIGPETTSYLDIGAAQRIEPNTPTPIATPTQWPATPTPIPTCS